MALTCSRLPIAITLLIFIPSVTISQVLGPLSPPTVADCGSRLLPLAPCAPFVQGASPEPNQVCCDNLKLVYNQQPACLCLFLNGTTLSSLSLNSTRVLQLPGLCSPQIDPSLCPGVSAPPPPPPSPVASGTNSSTSAAGSTPPVTTAPRPSAIRFGYGQSAADKLKDITHFAVLASASTLLLICYKEFTTQ
ncbi:hypothetical protein Ancab_029928 [Ancistrocladus abbreviatus]